MICSCRTEFLDTFLTEADFFWCFAHDLACGHAQNCVICGDEPTAVTNPELAILILSGPYTTHSLSTHHGLKSLGLS